MIALILSILLNLLCMGDVKNEDYSAYIMIEPWDIEDEEWAEYKEEAFQEYCAMFDEIYGKIEYKVSKNGRPMVKGAYSNSFKFVSKGRN